MLASSDSRLAKSLRGDESGIIIGGDGLVRQPHAERGIIHEFAVELEATQRPIAFPRWIATQQRDQFGFVHGFILARQPM